MLRALTREVPFLARKPSTNARGEIEVVTPLSFKPGMDRVLVNDGKGGRIPQNINDSESAKSTGLGVIIADFDGVPGTWDKALMNTPEAVAEVVWQGYQSKSGCEDLEVPARS